MGMKQTEALKLALEALEFYYDQHGEESDAKAITAIREALAEQPAQQRIDYRAECWPESPHYKPAPLAEQPAQQQEPVAWCPDVCPITGLPFFMWIEHHETGQMVPTYGGPYDSYTIPVRDKDGSYCRERYDHDRGGWLTDEVEDVGVQIVSDQAYVSDEPPASKPWVGLTDEEVDECYYWKDRQWTTDELVRHVEAKLREKNA